MLKLPVYGFFVTLCVVPVLSVVLAHWWFRSSPRATRWLGTFLLSVVLFLPVWHASIQAVDWWETWSGRAEATRVPKVFWVSPPETGGPVTYFKNWIVEWYVCEIDEREYERWCQRHEMVEKDSPFGPSQRPTNWPHDRFPTCEPDREFEIKEFARDGGGYHAWYCRSTRELLYIARYW
jgi:hypothetical protein